MLMSFFFLFNIVYHYFIMYLLSDCATVSCPVLVFVYCMVLSSDARLCNEKPFISQDVTLDSAIDFLVVKEDCNRIDMFGKQMLYNLDCLTVKFTKIY